MKKIIIFFFLCLLSGMGVFAQVGINSDNSQPDPSAMLDVKSSVKGLLPPRVALTATNVASPVSAPAIGLQVYNISTSGTEPFNVKPGLYNWDGTKWIPVSSPQGVNTGDMQYWNGTQWVLIPAGAYGQQLFFCNGIPKWGGCQPVLTTTEITNISAFSCVSGGNISQDGGLPVLSKGVCWSTNPNPTIGDSKTTDGNGTGSYVSNVSGLTPNTHYYLRSYATNNSGTGYGIELNFTTLCESSPTVGVSISASANPICSGLSVSITAIPVNGGSSPTFQWMKNGTNITGATNSTYSYIPANNDNISCLLTSNVPCATGNPATSNTVTLIVNSPPTVPVAGTHASSQVEIVWNWNTVPGATGYKWNTSNDFATATDMGISTTKTETGLTCNTPYTRYAWAYNACDHSTPVALEQTTSACAGFTCGQSLTVNHVAGNVAPINKTVTYGTVTNIPGETSKCWITSNLGADHQATSVSDATEASAGWYWQFNRKQGFSHDGTARTPNSIWITNINETTDWLNTNDPCTIEIGEGWRIPTSTEWTNVDASGGWTAWTGPWGSNLKLHAAGSLDYTNGSLNSRGSSGRYWSNTQNSSLAGWFLNFGIANSSITYNYKIYGFSARCLSNVCGALLSPTQDAHVSSSTQIIWNWNTVFGATGYKWNTTNDYGTAIDVGITTTKTEAGLSCNTAYSRYVWAYDACGNSMSVLLTKTTSACSFTCGQSLTVSHVAGSVAPVNKSVTYGTVTNIPGETAKCWITQNLGASQQAIAVDDATEVSAGWYWQFNHKQGYKHDGSARTPSTVWNSANDNLSATWEASKDPCSVELGLGWRIPTNTEWTNVNASGVWTTWTGPWNSNLKLHASGYLDYSGGSLNNRGSKGYYWSNAQYSSTDGWHIDFGSGYSGMNVNYKAYGFSLRCLRE